MNWYSLAKIENSIVGVGFKPAKDIYEQGVVTPCLFNPSISIFT
jgi:hypothetical protein